MITFAHCVSASDGDDLALLKEVLDTLDHISSSQRHSHKQYELCKALYRTAEEHLAPRLSICAPEHFGHAESGNWAWLDTNELLDPFIAGRAVDWDSSMNLDNIIYNLGNRVGEHNT